MILPGATLGVLGGGQLGQMFALRARTMGYRIAVLDPDLEAPAAPIADRQLLAPYDDENALDDFATMCAAVTTEFENVPATTLEYLAGRTIVRPGAAAVRIAQDRIAEKGFLSGAGFAVAPFRPVTNLAELEAALDTVRVPALLKTSRLGYDGKGQVVISTRSEAAEAYQSLGSVACILEERLELELELSVVLGRGVDGRIVAFPAGENRHRDGILETTTVPARVSAELAGRALALARDVAEALDYVGVLGVELFVAEGGKLLVNEIAPRPHNSGHYTIDACSLDQFELQVRTLCSLPLVEPRLLCPVTMINLLGDLWCDGEPRWEEALRRPGVRLQLYGKSAARPGRKMGHLNCLASNPDEALALAFEARDALPQRAHG